MLLISIVESQRTSIMLSTDHITTIHIFNDFRAQHYSVTSYLLGDIIELKALLMTSATAGTNVS